MKKYDLEEWQGYSQLATVPTEKVLFGLIDTVIEEANAKWSFKCFLEVDYEAQQKRMPGSYTVPKPLWYNIEEHGVQPQLIEEIKRVVDNPKKLCGQPIVLDMPLDFNGLDKSTDAVLRGIEKTEIKFYNHPQGLLIEISYDDYGPQDYILCHR